MSDTTPPKPSAQAPARPADLIPCAQQQIRDIEQMLHTLPPHHRKRVRCLLSASFQEALGVLKKVR